MSTSGASAFRGVSVGGWLVGNRVSHLSVILEASTPSTSTWRGFFTDALGTKLSIGALPGVEEA